MVGNRRRDAVALGVVVALVFGYAVGWLVAQRDEGPEVPGWSEFDATLDSVEPDGLRACLRPLDPALLERFGGPVCGRVFVAGGMAIAASQRVHVEWFTVVTREEGESVDAMALSPLR